MFNLIKKKKALILSLLMIVVGIILLLIFLGLFYKDSDKNKDVNNDSSNASDYTGDNNANIDGENFVTDVDGNRANTSSNIIKLHEIDNVGIITNMRITSTALDPEYVTLSFDFVNKTGELKQNMPLKLKFYSQDKKLISEFEIEIKAAINDQATSCIYFIPFPIIDAYDYTFEILKTSSLSGAGG